ncbi:hypothetical protein EDB89DRAFT_2040567 [Lactarius sanguifluus]|nr:hypothetical protein EDB89DRAFT_2040567 [Lactarius sanguifluus]
MLKPRGTFCLYLCLIRFYLNARLAQSDRASDSYGGRGVLVVSDHPLPVVLSAQKKYSRYSRIWRYEIITKK